MFNPATTPVQPILSLTPFLGGKPWIKARAVDKGEIRTWNKPTSTGKLFSCTLVDESASIRITFFNEGVDQFFNMISNGSVYYISGFSIKNANRRFSNVNNDYELSGDRETQVHLARDAASAMLPTQRYNFVPIHVLSHKEKGSVVDLLAVVINVSDVSKITQKATGNELTKKTVTIADTTASVELTVWNEECERFTYGPGTVLAMKCLRLGDFDGLSLGTTRETSFDASAESMPDAAKLKQWYASTGGTTVAKLTTGRKMMGDSENSNFRNHGRKFLSAVESERLGRTPEKTDCFECVCVPTFVRTENVWYDSCPKCNKKVTPMADGRHFRCEKCNADVIPEPRYLCSIQASDNVTTQWMTLFNEAGDVFWGMKASQLKEKSQANPTLLTQLTSQRLHVPLLLSIRAKEDRGGPNMDMAADGPQQDRVRLTVNKIQDLLVANKSERLIEESRKLIEVISAYHAPA